MSVKRVGRGGRKRATAGLHGATDFLFLPGNKSRFAALSATVEFGLCDPQPHALADHCPLRLREAAHHLHHPSVRASLPRGVKEGDVVRIDAHDGDVEPR